MKVATLTTGPGQHYAQEFEENTGATERHVSFTSLVFQPQETKLTVGE